jgi:exodeoxyribonuclease VII large subunit
MAFNEEVVARAVAACPVPVITAVGHEVDVTVVDLVADLRAATPSEAAERAVPTRRDVADRLGWGVERSRRALRERLVAESRGVERLQARLPSPDGLLGPPRQALDEAVERGHRALAGAVEGRRRRLEELRRRLAAAHPGARLARDRGRVDTLRSRLVGWKETGLAACWAHLDLTAGALRGFAPGLCARHRERLGAASARLEALSPLAVLGRGYAVARDETGRVLLDARAVAVGQRVDVTLARGRLGCDVREVDAGGPERAARGSGGGGDAGG